MTININDDNQAIDYIDLLNDYQKNTLEECLKKGSGGIAAKVGFGKTILALVMGLKYHEMWQTERNGKGNPDNSNGKCLIIMSKSLIGSWISELKKFFRDEVPYQVLHSDYVPNMSLWQLKAETKIVLTTSDVMAKLYNDNNMGRHFIDQVRLSHFSRLEHTVSNYNRPINPLLPQSNNAKESDKIYCEKWTSMFVDEVQRYSNIQSNRCKAISAVCSPHRWALSGTMFDEPKIERILGYHLIINDPIFPRSLPSAEAYMRRDFKGMKRTIVQRNDTPFWTPPKTNHHIINHSLTANERSIYLILKSVMQEINEKAQNAGNAAQRRVFSSYLLSLIVYLRQCVISPLIPIASVCLDIYDATHRSELSSIIRTSLKKHNLSAYLDNETNVKTSRIEKVMEVCRKHEKDKIIIFSTFRTAIDLLDAMLRLAGRQTMILTGAMKANARIDLLESFSKSAENPVLLLTYNIGGEGLNLQSCATVLLVDLWWNQAKTEQAIGRVLRQGQRANVVDVYYFTSDTAIENVIFKKQKDKLQILQDLQSGPTERKVTTISTKDIVRFVNAEKNVLDLTSLTRT